MLRSATCIDSVEGSHVQAWPETGRSEELKELSGSTARLACTSAGRVRQQGADHGDRGLRCVHPRHPRFELQMQSPFQSDRGIEARVREHD